MQEALRAAGLRELPSAARQYYEECARPSQRQRFVEAMTKAAPSLWQPNPREDIEGYMKEHDGNPLPGPALATPKVTSTRRQWAYVVGEGQFKDIREVNPANPFESDRMYSKLSEEEQRNDREASRWWLRYCLGPLATEGGYKKEVLDGIPKQTGTEANIPRQNLPSSRYNREPVMEGIQVRLPMPEAMRRYGMVDPWVVGKRAVAATQRRGLGGKGGTATLTKRLMLPAMDDGLDDDEFQAGSHWDAREAADALVARLRLVGQRSIDASTAEQREMKEDERSVASGTEAQHDLLQAIGSMWNRSNGTDGRSVSASVAELALSIDGVPREFAGEVLRRSGGRHSSEWTDSRGGLRSSADIVVDASERRSRSTSPTRESLLEQELGAWTGWMERRRQENEAFMVGMKHSREEPPTRAREQQDLRNAEGHGRSFSPAPSTLDAAATVFGNV